MKNKKMTYVLIAAVAIVWGLIGYRIFAAVDGNDDEAIPAPAVKMSKEPAAEYDKPLDTVKLVLNYRDPFTEQKEKEVIAPTAIKVFHPEKSGLAVAKPKMDWGFIQYTGYVRNPDTRKLIALITVHGKALMLGEGERSDGVLLVKNLKDSIKVVVEGKTKFFSMN